MPHLIEDNALRGVDVLRIQTACVNAIRYNSVVPPQNASRRRQKSPPPGDTGQEALYLRFLSEKQVAVKVKLRDGETLTGWIEYFDDRMIRLTREGAPNLFIYKHQIRTITENSRRDDLRRRARRQEEVAHHGEEIH